MNEIMNTKIWGCVFLLLALGGCGGGGGGGGGTVSTPGTTGPSVSVFAAGNLLNEPKHMVFDGSDLYVANYGGNNILKVDSAGTQSVRLTGITHPFGVTTDGEDLFVTGTVAGTGLGIYPFTINAGSLRALIATCNCYGVAATAGVHLSSGTGRLYAVDLTTRKVNVYSSAGAVASLDVVGVPTGLSINNGATYTTLFDSSVNPIIKKIDNATNTVSDFVNSTQLDRPNGIAVDPATGNVYVVNQGTSGSSSLLKITPAGIVSQYLSTSDGLCAATGVAIRSGSLYVSNGPCTSATTPETTNFILKASLP